MRVFSWADAKQAHITPIVWVQRSQLTPADAAAVVQAAFRNREPGTRGLFMRDTAFPGVWNISPADFVTKGLDVAGQSAWYAEFYSRLAATGNVPDIIVTDEEYSSVSAWALSANGADIAKALAPVFDDPSVLQYLPFFLQRYTSAAFQATGWEQAYADWNTYTDLRTNFFLTQIISDTATSVFGHPINIGNYESFRISIAVPDINGWMRQPTGSVLGNTSMPEIYSWERGKRWAARPDIAWLQFLDNLNTMRSCVNFYLAQRAPLHVMPWVAFPSFTESPTPGATSSQERWEIWRHQILHARACGIENFMYWNPGASEADEEFASGVFAEAASIEPVKQPAWPLLQATVRAVASIIGPGLNDRIATSEDQVTKAA